MIKHLKSNTIQSALFIGVTQLPTISDPIWGVVAETGLDPRIVAGVKVTAFVLGLVGVWWGRAKVQGPLS